MPTEPRRVFEDDEFLLEPAAGDSIPGYLILRLKTGATSMSDLDASCAAALGRWLSAATSAIEGAVAADRVYCLAFCEVDRHLHFHLFPRTEWLLEAYWRANGKRDEPVNGPLLFEWARSVHDLRAPEGTPSVQEVCDAVRARLMPPTEDSRRKR